MVEIFIWKIAPFWSFGTYLTSKWPLVTFNDLEQYLVVKLTMFGQNNWFPKNFEKNHPKKSGISGQVALLIRPLLFLLRVTDFLIFIRLQAPHKLYFEPIKSTLAQRCHMFICKILLQTRKTAPPTGQKFFSKFFF